MTRIARPSGWGRATPCRTLFALLGAVKTEFGKFREVLDKVKKQLHTAGDTIEETGRRTRAMERRLRQVEELPGDLALSVLGLPADGVTPLRAADGNGVGAVEDKES